MATNKGKKFTLKDLDIKVDHINKQEKYFTNEEADEYISYFPRFSQTKKDKLFEELVSTSTYVEEKKLGFLENEFEVIQYVQFLIFKYFTSLHNELDGKSVETHFETFYKLYDSGLLSEFLVNVFDQEEISKVFDQFYDILEIIPKLKTKEDEIRVQALQTVKNDEIRKKIIPEV